MSEVPAPPLPDELDLTRYLGALWRRWPPVVGLGLLGALVLFGYSVAQPKMYQAEATVIVLSTTMGPPPGTPSTDPRDWRRSLLSIPKTADFATAALERLGAQLPPELKTPESVLRRVDVTNDGDVIRIRGTDVSPELAAQLANTWSDLYIARINAAYAVRPDSDKALAAQAKQAGEAYEACEAELVTDLSAGSLEQHQRQGDLLDKQLASSDAVSLKLAQLEADARALKALTDSSGRASEPAQAMLEVNVFNSVGDSPVRLEPSPGAGSPQTPGEASARLQALIVAIQSRRAGLDGLSSVLLTQQAGLRAQLEQEGARRKQLEAARDLAWNTYQELAKKVSASAAAARGAGDVVRAASAAVPPTEPLPGRTAFNTLIGGMIGLALGTALAVVLQTRSPAGRPPLPAPEL